MIEIKNLTMKYKTGKGVFDVDFQVREGEVVGFLGPNGAGKTTTIRCLMGFMQGEIGECVIDKKDCWKDAPEIAKDLGYIAGEPAFPDGMTGSEYINFLCNVRKTSEEHHKQLKARAEELVRYFEVDPRGKIRRMSKGMKQKIAIIAAFLHSPKMYILDEPTSGLDPIMQSKFVDLILKEKKQGKTILMSSHMFDEVERLADFVIIIKDGRIVAKDKVANLKQVQKKIFIVHSKVVKTIKSKFDKNIVSDTMAEFLVPANDVDTFIKEIAKFKIDGFSSKEISLESVFMDHYSDNKGGVAT